MIGMYALSASEESPDLIIWSTNQSKHDWIHQVSIHLLMLHQPRVRAVIDHARAEYWLAKLIVNILGIQVLWLAIEDNFVPFSTKIYCRLIAQEDESEAVAILIL